MDTTEQLLHELAWLRRVAAKLVGDDAAAGDLTQEVALEALRRPPTANGEPLEGARLRGWLWLVARRKARRARERRDADLTAEGVASRAEGVDGLDRSAQQLALYRDLLAEIHALGSADADLIVQRYLDQRPPREIALVLKLPVPTVRKRLSRAMHRLRARLVESERGAEGWSLGLCVILGARPAPVPVSVEAARLRTAGGVSAWKVAALALSGLGFGAAWILVGYSTSQRGHPVAPSVAVAVEGAETPVLVPGAEPSSRPVAQRVEVALSPVDATLASEDPAEQVPRSRIHFVDEAGAPVLDARAIWADEDSTPHVLEIDDAGVALLPQHARGWIYAGASGFENGDASIAWSSTDAMHVQLRRQRAIPGQLLIDGGVPGVEITLFQDRGGSNLWPYSADGDERLKSALRDHNLDWSRTTITTDRDGSFVFTTLTRWSDYFLRTPLNVRLLGAEGVLGFQSDSIQFDRETPRIELSGTRLDSLEGKIVWSDDLQPVMERFDFYPCAEDGERLARFSVAADSKGNFSLPLMAEDRDGARGEVTWSRWELHLGKIELRGKLQEEGATRSLSTIEVPRGSMKHFRVVGRGSEGLTPVLAVLSSDTEQAATRSNGTASLHATSGASVRVMARGYQARVAAVMPWSAHSDTPETIELEPAPRLRVRIPLEHRIGLDPSRSVVLALRAAPTAFAGMGATQREQNEFWRLYRRLCGQQFRHFRPDDFETPTGPGSAYFQGLPNRDLWIDGLRPGASFTAELQDQFGARLASKPVVMPALPPSGKGEVHVLEFEDLYSTGAAALQGQCRWPSGGRPYQGHVSIYRGDGRRIEKTQANASGEFALGPLVPGRYFIVARQDGSTPKPGEGIAVVLVPGMNLLTIDAIGPEPD